MLFPYISPINSWGFGSKQHTEITRNALSFLKPDILDEVVAAILSEDEGWTDLSLQSYYGENHFDACRFTDSVNNINNKYESIISDLKTHSNPLVTFGELLHPVQDFYSHSNWVEMGWKDHIVENGETSWSGFASWWPLSNPKDQDVIVVEGDLPSGWTMTSGIVPKITGPFGEKAGLFTFHRGWKPGNECPDELKMWKHPQLNKDGDQNAQYAGDMAKYSEYHNKAKSLAVTQTAHEWCRLLNKVDSSQGSSGVKELFNMWVADLQKAISTCDSWPSLTHLYKDIIFDAGISKPLYQSQLFNCDPNSDTLEVNTKGDKVIELKTYLTDLGYGDLLGAEKNDPVFGKVTENSVITYQTDFGLPVIGKVDSQTWASLCGQISTLPKMFPTNTNTNSLDTTAPGNMGGVSIADTGSSDVSASDMTEADTGTSDMTEADTGTSDLTEADTGTSDTTEADTGTSDTSTAIQNPGCHPSTEVCQALDLLLHDDDTVLCDPSQGIDCSPYLNQSNSMPTDGGGDQVNGGTTNEFDWLTGGDANIPVIDKTDPPGQYCNPLVETCDPATISPGGCSTDITTHNSVCDYSNTE